MADNVTANTGSGGSTFASDDIGGIQYPRTKITVGADGTNDGDVSSANPLPVSAALSATDNAVLDAIAASLAGTLSVDGSGVTQPISGTITANLSAIDNAVLDAIAASLTGTLAVDGSGVTQPVSGTVTANLGATDNAVLDAIAASVSGTVTVDGSGVTQPISGTVTANLSATDNSVLDAIASSLAGTLTVTGGGGGTQYTDNAAFVPGTGLVTAAGGVYQSSPATLASGDAGAILLDSSARIVVAPGSAQATISSTDVIRVALFDASDTQVTSFGGGTEYTEDAAAATNPVGKANILVRADSPAGIASADGDNVAQRGSNYGAAFVQVVDSSGNLVNTFTGAGTEYTEGDTDASITGIAMLMEVASNTLQPVQGTVANGLLVNLGTNNDITGTVTANLSATDNAVLDAIAASVGGTLTVGSHAVTNAGTFATQAAQSGTWNVTNISGTVSLPTGAATSSAQSTQTTALQLIDNMIVAHDAAATGASGLSMGGFEARNTEPSAVSATGDATRGIATMLGKQVTMPFSIPASSWGYASATSGVVDTSDDVAKASAGAGIRNYITGVQVFNGHATVSTEVVIKDGSTVLWRGYAYAAGGGCSAQFNPPLRGTAATAVNVANITTGSATYFNLQGFVAAE